MTLESEKFPSDIQHLALYTGNIMTTSVGGRNSIFHEKTNKEVSMCCNHLIFRTSNLNFKNKILEAIDDTLDYSDRLNYRYYKDTKLLEVPDLRTSSRINPKDRDHMEITGMQLYF